MNKPLVKIKPPAKVRIKPSLLEEMYRKGLIEQRVQHNSRSAVNGQYVGFLQTLVKPSMTVTEATHIPIATAEFRAFLDQLPYIR
jgi:hypothetical protein